MAFTRFTLRQIETFLAVAEHLSFAVAANKLGLTAQAVSQLIAELESLLDFKLFDRTTRRVELSSAGRDFWPHAQALSRQVVGAQSAIDDVRNRAAGIVRVAAPLVLACTAMPQAIEAFQRTRPRVVVRIRDVAVERLTESVANGDVDLAVGPDRPTGHAVSRHDVFESPWVMWCSPGHPLAGRQHVPWAQLRDHTAIAAGYDHEHSIAQMHAHVPEGMRVTPVDVVDNITTALGIAAQGKAVTLAPAYVGAMAHAFGLSMHRVTQPETVRKVCVYQATARTPSPVVAAFAEHLTAWLPQWAQGVGT